jgi:hypothetical protein
MKQLQSCNPRLVQIHAGILVGSDAFESGIHDRHEVEDFLSKLRTELHDAIAKNENIQIK